MVTSLLNNCFSCNSISTVFNCKIYRQKKLWLGILYETSILYYIIRLYRFYMRYIYRFKRSSFSLDSLCSLHNNTCYFFGYFEWEGCGQAKSCWHFPSLCLPWFQFASGNRHWIENPLFLVKENLCASVLSAKVRDEKYWISLVSLGPFVATCLDSLSVAPQIWHLSFLFWFDKWVEDLYLGFWHFSFPESSFFCCWILIFFLQKYNEFGPKSLVVKIKVNRVFQPLCQTITHNLVNTFQAITVEQIYLNLVFEAKLIRSLIILVNWQRPVTIFSDSLALRDLCFTRQATFFDKSIFVSPYVDFSLDQISEMSSTFYNWQGWFWYGSSNSPLISSVTPSAFSTWKSIGFSSFTTATFWWVFIFDLTFLDCLIEYFIFATRFSNLSLYSVSNLSGE